MKKDKIGTIFLISVLAFAGIGVSYAGFFDDIYVYGDVSTATVTFEVLNYSGTWVYKVYGWDVEPDEPTDLFPGCVATFNSSQEILIVRGFHQPTDAMLDDWLMGDGTWMGPVAFAYAYDASPGDDVKDVGMNWWQVFPCVDFTADILVHYTGCIPAKVAISPLAWLDLPGYFDFSEYTTITYLKLGDMGETIPVLPPVQMHYCELLWIQVTIHLPQINALQGLIGGFTFTVHAQQWNELCEPDDSIGNTLITDPYNQVIEVDNTGTIVWSYSTGLDLPSDAERLTNGNTLIADAGNNRVIEVNNAGTIVWSYSTGLYQPTDAERLTNGNTLITDSIHGQVIEVDNAGTIVWSYSAGSTVITWDAERLTNGNTLISISESNNCRVIEVDNAGTIVWSYSTGTETPSDAERLTNGNTLITETSNHQVIEVNNAGTIVWSYSTGLALPMDAERLTNGNTLISDSANHRVIEVDNAGTIVWSYSTGLTLVWDAERI